MKVYVAVILLWMSFAAVVKAQTAKDETIPFKQETGLQIREIQYQQGKLLVEELKLQIRYNELEKQIETSSALLRGICEKAAAAQKVALDKYGCNLDSLRFQPKPK